MNLKQSIGVIYQKRYERENKYQSCEAYFHRIIGVENEADYCDSLRTLEEYIKDHKDITLFLENDIPMVVEFSLIESIKQVLIQMNILELSKQDILIFNDKELNQLFLLALEKVVHLAIQQENFFSEYTRNDFIAKLIVWTYSYLQPLRFDDHYIPKFIYYGTIDRHSIYFLMLAYHMGVDVLYLNPLKEELFSQIDLNKWSTYYQAMGLLPINTFEQYSKRGSFIHQLETTTKTIQQNVHNMLFDNTGIFKPWQFRGGMTIVLTLDTILEDIYSYWNEHARVRQGFKVVDNTVYVPCFFYKIDGVYKDSSKYKRLLEHCTANDATLFFHNDQLLNIDIIQNDLYQLMFCQLSNGAFDLDEVKKLPFYRFSNYSEETRQFLIKKFNEFIFQENIFVKSFSNEEILKLFYLILMVDECFIRAIDNFDFTATVPKLVIFLDKEEQMREESIQLLGYLHRIGFDICIFNPSGLFNMNKVLNSSFFILNRLETMDYELTYNASKQVKKGFLKTFYKQLIR